MVIVFSSYCSWSTTIKKWGNKMHVGDLWISNWTKILFYSLHKKLLICRSLTPNKSLNLLRQLILNLTNEFENASKNMRINPKTKFSCLTTQKKNPLWYLVCIHSGFSVYIIYNNFKDLVFQSPKYKWSKNLVETVYNQQIFFLRK
jgi:hypothetical protein